MTGVVENAFRVWRAGVALGLRTLPRDRVLGLKRLILPVSYWRTVEFAYTMRHLDFGRGARVLDVGSPKQLGIIMAQERGYAVLSTDILQEEVNLTRRYAEANRLVGSGPGSVAGQLEDGRALSFPTASFDAAFSISVLEHIPDRGDSQAMAELARVVRPGGRIVVTVPYDRQYHETFVDGPVYERGRVGDKPLFFERHYDADTLRERLLCTPGARLVDLELWGESTVRMERLLRLLGRGRDLLSPFEAGLAAAFLRRLPPDGQGHPMAAFMTLERL